MRVRAGVPLPFRPWLRYIHSFAEKERSARHEMKRLVYEFRFLSSLRSGQ